MRWSLRRRGRSGRAGRLGPGHGPRKVPSRRARSAQLGDLGDQLGGPVGVAPLVVVPGDGLDHVAADDGGPVGHEDARVRVADDVAGDQRVGRVLDDPLERARRRRP